jgi:hypothetical protein
MTKGTVLLLTANLVLLGAVLFTDYDVKAFVEQSVWRPLNASAIPETQQWMDKRYANGAKFPDDPLAHCGDPCVIRDNQGGHMMSFIFAARTLYMRKKVAVIEGDCKSACALFADLARPMVCISKDATLWFHKTSEETDPPQSQDIDKWVRSYGGYPSYASGMMLKMETPAILKFWPVCEMPKRK